jgi:hypothetical protein
MAFTRRETRKDGIQIAAVKIMTMIDATGCGGLSRVRSAAQL